MNACRTAAYIIQRNGTTMHCKYDPFIPCEDCGKCRRSDDDERDPDRDYELKRDEGNVNE